MANRPDQIVGGLCDALTANGSGRGAEFEAQVDAQGGEHDYDYHDDQGRHKDIFNGAAPSLVLKKSFQHSSHFSLQEESVFAKE